MNLFQPKLGYKNHLLAEAQSKNISVMENRASVMLDNEEYEKSLLTYLNGVKKRIRPLDFIFGVLKVVSIVKSCNVGLIF